MDAKDYRLSSTYVSTIDGRIEDAYEALLQIDPMATRLSALGVENRAIWCESSEATGLTDADGAQSSGSACSGGSALAARPRGSAGGRLTQDGAGRAVFSTLVRATASNGEAGKRVVALWPLVETIALEHAKGLRRAIDTYTEDAFAADWRQVRLAA